MKNTLTFIVLSLIGGQYASAEDLRQLLQDAIAAPEAGIVETITPTGHHEYHADTDEEYVKARDRVVLLGQAAVPELQAISAGPESSWQERIMAGICLERIQKGPEIREFANYDFRNDPDLRDLPGWDTRVGYPGKFYQVSTERLFSTGLRHYWLELVWKRISEHPRMGRDWDKAGAAALIKAGDPDPDLVHVMRYYVERIRDPKHIAESWHYQYLIRLKDHASLPLLFDLWLQYREVDWPRSFQMYLRYHPGEEERCREFATQDSTRMLAGLLAIALPEDAGWITQKLQGIPLGSDAQKALNAYLQRVGDTTSPVITILGNNPLSIQCGLTYTDAGATATDNKDGNLTGSITTTSMVNTDAVGTYTVTYSVKDAVGNEATATRTVEVRYSFDGFLAPIAGADASGGTAQAPVKTFKAGSKIPVKFTIGCGIGLIHDGVHTLQVVKWNNEATAAEPIDASPADAATEGNQFRWADDHWHYILDTQSMNMGVGVWELRATLSDGSKHSVFIGVK